MPGKTHLSAATAVGLMLTAIKLDADDKTCQRAAPWFLQRRLETHQVARPSHRGSEKYQRRWYQMRLGGWRDVKSVQRYVGLLSDERLTAAVEAAWA